MNKKFYLIASLLLASAQMGLAQNGSVEKYCGCFFCFIVFCIFAL